MFILKLILTIFLSFIAWIVTNQYFFCPRYSFNKLMPFSGDAFYNPYASIDSGHWIKCNFHAHTYVWKGITNGHGTARDVYRVYDSLGYSVHCVSNYQTLDTTLRNAPGYVPAYEHGYGMGKTHQTVLGSDKVLWLEYIFPQTINNRQHILNSLTANPNTVVILNHPSIRNGYRYSDLKYLTNYHCMEVLNPSTISMAHWDSALSYGKPVFIVGSDDVHDVMGETRVGAMCTWVNVSSLSKENVLDALRSGKSYGMIVGKSKTDLPGLKSFDLSNGIVSVEMNRTAKEIKFLGQHGRILSTYPDTSSAQYTIQPTDNYVRVQISFENENEIFLNPVFRYDKTKIGQVPVSVNTTMTFIFRLMGVIIGAVWIWWMFLFLVPKRRRKRVNNFLARLRNSNKRLSPDN